MPISTFMGLETALRGILAQQEALDVAGHNIANANTAGYTRQTVDLKPFYPFGAYGRDNPLVGGQLGGGVDAGSISRMRDQYLDVQYRTQNYKSGHDQALADGLQQVDQTLAEPSDQGLSNLFADFASAWQDVANDPQSQAARQALVQKGKALADGISSLYGQLSTYASQNDTLEDQTVTDLNSYTRQITALNTQIKNAEAVGMTPNDLLDQRDNLIDKVQNLVNAQPLDNGDGTISLSVGSGANKVDLIDSGNVQHDVQMDATRQSIQWVSGGTTTAAVTTGKLGGLVDYASDLKGYMTSLDGVATQLINDYNASQSSGYDLYDHTGATANAFFSGTDAATIAIDPTLFNDPKLIAAASAAASPGDGSHAIAAGGLSASSDLYQTLVTRIGSDAQAAQRSSDASNTLLGSISNRRLSVSGVSLDEEMTNLLKFQRGYQASARALTAMDDMIDLLVTRTGRAGL
jgi:flagellar hook-associated protein 1 FlgK